MSDYNRRYTPLEYRERQVQIQESNLMRYLELHDGKYSKKQKEEVIDKVIEELAPAPTIDLAKVCDDLALNDALPSPRLLELKRIEKRDKRITELKKKIIDTVKKSSGKIPIELWYRNETSWEEDNILEQWLKPQGYQLCIVGEYSGATMQLSYYKPSRFKKALTLTLGGTIILGVGYGAIRLIGILIGVIFG